MLDPNAPVYYYGCWTESGHYLHDPSGRPALHGTLGPFKVEDLDWPERWAPPETVGETQERLHHVDGWTVLSMLDRSVDRRPASHATFVAPGTLDAPAVWALAEAHFPHVVARLQARRRYLASSGIAT